MKELKRKANTNLNKLKDLMIAKEIWLEKLRRKFVQMQKHKERDKSMKNDIFQKIKKTNERSECKGQVPTMDKFVKFRAGIWEYKSETRN